MQHEAETEVINRVLITCRCLGHGVMWATHPGCGGFF